MALKADGADLCFKDGLLNGTRGIAAFSAADTELTGNAYARISRALSNWRSDTNGYVNDGLWEFPQPTPAAWLAITHWGIYSGTITGNLLYDYDSTDTAAPQLGASVGFADGAIGIKFSGGKFTDAGGLKICNEGLVSGTRALTLHSGTTAATGNFIDQPVSVAAAAWTADTIDHTPGTSDGQKHRRLRNNAQINFGVAITDLAQPMSVALRDGTDGSSAAILWSSVFDPAAGDPGLGDAITFAANAIEITLPID